MLRSAWLVIAFVAPAVALAQGQGTGRAGKRTLLGRDFEIALARSAAPTEV